MKKVFIKTLGCKVNQFESASFATTFQEAGLQIVGKNDKADIVVINSCAVTASAGAQSRQTVRKHLRANPAAKIIITGCYAELAAEEFSKEKELSGRDYYLIGNSKKDQLVDIAMSGEEENRVILGAIADVDEICRLPVRHFGNRSRAYLRVQDGCNSYCTYCIVPFTRGISRSLPLQEVLEQAKIFAAEGHKEIVLTGIHLGYYGQDLEVREDIVTLLEALTSEIPELYFRISSLEPLEISPALLALMRERSTIQPHLHIPLQNGDDEILSRMNRRYSLDQFRKVVEMCHDSIPDMALGIDILAGFPGETEEKFENAQQFLKTLEFSYLHVFPYSIRPGTKAATFPNQIPTAEKERRVNLLRALSEENNAQFIDTQLGKTRTVIVENGRDSNNHLKGISDNYINVRFPGKDSLLGSVQKVQLVSRNGSLVLGKLEQGSKNEG